MTKGAQPFPVAATNAGFTVMIILVMSFSPFEIAVLSSAFRSDIILYDKIDHFFYRTNILADFLRGFFNSLRYFSAKHPFCKRFFDNFAFFVAKLYSVGLSASLLRP